MLFGANFFALIDFTLAFSTFRLEFAVGENGVFAGEIELFNRTCRSSRRIYSFTPPLIAIFRAKGFFARPLFPYGTGRNGIGRFMQENPRINRFRHPRHRTIFRNRITRNPLVYKNIGYNSFFETILDAMGSKRPLFFAEKPHINASNCEDYSQ
jgi:hypothetical protein